MTHLRVQFQRAVSRVSLAIAAFFETGVDSVIREFVSLDEKLETYVSRREAELDRIVDDIGASFDRVTAVRDAEAKHREALDDRFDAIHHDRVRAQKIRQAVRNLIGE